LRSQTESSIWNKKSAGAGFKAGLPAQRNQSAVAFLEAGVFQGFFDRVSGFTRSLLDAAK
jgi:hypothetical protein